MYREKSFNFFTDLIRVTDDTENEISFSLAQLTIKAEIYVQANLITFLIL